VTTSDWRIHRPPRRGINRFFVKICVSVRLASVSGKHRRQRLERDVLHVVPLQYQLSDDFSTSGSGRLLFGMHASAPGRFVVETGLSRTERKRKVALQFSTLSLYFSEISTIGHSSLMRDRLRSTNSRVSSTSGGAPVCRSRPRRGFRPSDLRHPGSPGN